MTDNWTRSKFHPWFLPEVPETKVLTLFPVRTLFVSNTPDDGDWQMDHPETKKVVERKGRVFSQLEFCGYRK